MRGPAGEPWFGEGAPIGADLDDFPEFPLSDDEVQFEAPNLLPVPDANLLPSEILARFRADPAIAEPPGPPEDDGAVDLPWPDGAAP